ncbi:helix-turn-helix domain-containing protein [Frondihabitans sp. PAMC 28766]|uniref:AraC family transcriptional regulator n=1 Tax=Frondihabitans sp. PAMC 28766 TaxID=1795630 RepID=UPI00138F6D7A|nr:helix-turn-helix domain-containing protein [Frondihabitans sp. PAMC 28766]
MTEAANPRVRIEAEGTDLEQALDLFRVAYNGGGEWSGHVTDRDFSYRHTAVGDGDMTLRNTRFLGRICGEMAPEDDYVVSWVTEGYGFFDTAGEKKSLTPGLPFLFPTDRPVSFDMADVEQKLVHFHKPLLERVAAEHYGTAPGTLHLETAAPTESSVRAWRNALSLVSRTIVDADASAILRGEMARLAAVSLLGMFRPELTCLPPALLVPSHARLRVAVEFIHANAHLPITTTAIAATADLSLRALQEGFRRHLDVTPNAYLRQVRLDRVHEQLAQGAALTVAQVAGSWGFTHLGRFARAYQERFGEQPHQTKARVR